MSSAVGIIKEAGPYVVAVAGMAAGYFGARFTGRETRHHARVEALYQDMLDDLLRRRQEIAEAILAETPDPIAGLTVARSRILLYASPLVREAWDHSVQLQDAAALFVHHEHGIWDHRATDRLAAYDEAETELLQFMRSDLGVPEMSIRGLVKSNLMESRRDRRVRYQMSRDAAEQVLRR
jgi:signal transduction histidine kinase